MTARQNQATGFQHNIDKSRVFLMHLLADKRRSRKSRKGLEVRRPVYMRSRRHGMASCLHVFVCTMDAALAVCFLHGVAGRKMSSGFQVSSNLNYLNTEAFLASEMKLAQCITTRPGYGQSKVLAPVSTPAESQLQYHPSALPHPSSVMPALVLANDTFSC